MDQQLRPKLLQRALRKRPRVQLHPQRYLPAQVVVRPLLRFLVRHLLIRLQHKILERSRCGKRHGAQIGVVSVLSGAPYGYRNIRKDEGGGTARYEIVLVGVSSSPSFEDQAVMEFFRTSTGNLLGRGAAAGVGHHIALSVVGTERLSESGYFRAKTAQERLIKASSIPYPIVRATQFFEFVKSIAQSATDGNTVRLAPVLIQPMAADDVAKAVGRTSVGSPRNGIVEVAGPQQFRLDELIRMALRARGGQLDVIADPHARYYGALLDERTLVPGSDAVLFETRFEDWLREPVLQR